jgi:DNA-binding NarL/FixJ family response regulator
LSKLFTDTTVETANYSFCPMSEGVCVSRVSILLADDNSTVLDQVTKVLERDYKIVAALKDGVAVVRECLRLKPDVIVLDISLGDVNGIELARQLRDCGCYSKVVFLTVHEDYDFVNAAIGAGALGYVVKSHLSTDLISAIKAVLADKFFVSACLLY